MNHARAGAPDCLRDLLRPQAAAQHPAGGARTAQRRRVAREHLDLLAEMLANEPGEVLDGALLAAAGAVSIVQEQDHAPQT